MGALAILESYVRKVYVKGDENLGEAIYVDWRGQRYGQGPVLWAITCGPYCLGSDGEWEFEPQPSSRTDEFIARCRWKDLNAAILAAEASQSPYSK